MSLSDLDNSKETILNNSIPSIIKLPISLGEALDKYSILQIKESEIKDENRLKDVRTEILAILPSIESILKQFPYHYKCLYIINKEIWDLSAMVRDPSISVETKNNLFQETFYKNDARFRIKSKLNKLTDSKLREQKSYSASFIRIKSIDDITEYTNKNGYIRYLSLCFDNVILECHSHMLNHVTQMFFDDPHITTSEITDNIGESLHTYNLEPITNLYKNHDFSYINPVVNLNPPLKYICGGRLGDFIHELYVVKCKYDQTGRKGSVYITDNRAWGGDGFAYDLHRTYKELYEIVMVQPYIDSFLIYCGQNMVFDYNLNDFRRYPRLYADSWLEIMANTFAFNMTETPWITIPDSWIDPKYKDIVLIHRSIHRHIPEFLPLLELIIKQNKCLFVTGVEEEYKRFPFMNLVPIELKPTLKDMYVAIASCKFFIGNQSSPFAVAYSMFKSALCESSEGGFYIHCKHYQNMNWFSRGHINMGGLIKILGNDFGHQLSIMKTVKFNELSENVKQITKYFPYDYKGCCIDIGMKDPIQNNNTYYFEQKGWKCVCIEPDPYYNDKSKNIRLHVESVACSYTNNDNVVVTIQTEESTDDQSNNEQSNIQTEKIVINVRTLNNILESYSNIAHIDFIVINTEKNIIHILEGCCLNKWHPKLLIIENTSNESHVSQYLEPFGYRKVEHIDTKDYYLLF